MTVFLYLFAVFAQIVTAQEKENRLSILNSRQACGISKSGGHSHRSSRESRDFLLGTRDSYNCWNTSPALAIPKNADELFVGDHGRHERVKNLANLFS